MCGSLANSAIAQRVIAIEHIDLHPEQVRLRVLVPRKVLFTSDIPGFDRDLLQRLPLLWSTICHNDHGLAFADELRATEMGHVIEHVILALLTEHGIYAKGTTEWNWLEEPEGAFTITLFGDHLESNAVEASLADAMGLLEPLLMRQ